MIEFLTAALLATAPLTAVEAERAFARQAQIDGQWTAFRAWAAPDAIMFVPGPTNAQAFFKDFPDPQVAYMWWPASAWIACDGTAAVTTGPSVRGARRGYFTTVWVRQPDGAWKWVLDHGDDLARPRPAGEGVREQRASCTTPEPRLRPLVRPAGDLGGGQSKDGTLRWSWHVRPDGSRQVAAEMWNARAKAYRTILQDQVAAPAS